MATVELPAWFLPLTVMLSVYGVVRATLEYRARHDNRLLLVVAALLLFVTNQWLALYGPRLTSFFSSFALAASFVPVALFFAYNYLDDLRHRESAEKRKLREFFSKYVSPAIIHELLQKEAPQVGGRRQEVSVMFVDVRGFTPLSERLPPEEVVALLNRYFNVATDVIFKYGGTVDKFIGDAVMAFFNAPLPVKDHPMKAVEAAIELQRRMRELNRELRKKGEELHIGIGVSTGEAVIGNVGSRHFLDYTAIGDTVNTASRIQGKTGADEIAITPSTLARVKGRVKIASSVLVELKGKKEPLRIYKVKY
jgi:adenylate cyclase